jgi:thiamine pyrophosphokinase
MSSHHFVKEDQEPALLILSAKAISFEKVQELLEWSPTVIVSEEVVEEVIGWGIKIDIVLCEEAKIIPLKESLIDQAPIRFISYHSKSEVLSTAYYFLIASKYKAVNILINDPTQLDFIQPFVGMDVEVFYDDKRWVYVYSKKIEKWVAKSTQFYIYPKSTNFSINATGLNEDLKCLQDGIVSIESEAAFWLGESLES